jgi:hypothetical protein
MARTKGAINRKTKMLPAMLAALDYRDPAIVLAEIASMPDAELLKLCSSEGRRAALSARIRSAEALMPYVHGKRPVEVLVTDDRLPMLIIQNGTDQLEGKKANEINAAPLLVARPLVAQEQQAFDLERKSDD